MNDGEALPSELYPEVAPIPIPIAEHLYTRVLKKRDTSPQDLLAIIRQKRREVFLYMDPYVRNRERRDRDGNNEQVRYSAAWVKETLAVYSVDNREIPPSTYTSWLSRGIIRQERKGIPTPDSAASLFIAKMIDRGERTLPERVEPDEPAWWCYAQRSPTHAVKIIPITTISSLPPSTLVWTPWPGAAWDRRWALVGEDLGAIRFAGVHWHKGSIISSVSLEDLALWDSPAAALYIDSPDHTTQLPQLAAAALQRLATTRIKRRKDIL